MEYLNPFYLYMSFEIFIFTKKQKMPQLFQTSRFIFTGIKCFAKEVQASCTQI